MISKIVTRRFFCTTMTLLLVVLNNLYSKQQPAILEGKWQGTSSFLGKSYPIGFELNQEGNEVNGITYSLSEDAKSSYKYKIQGKVKGDRLTLTGTEFIEKSGLNCLASFNLKLVRLQDEVVLVGKWGSNLRKGGCFPGTSGKINVQKVQETSTASKTDVSNPTPESIEESDVYTKEMVKGLQKRNYHALIIGIQNYEDTDIVKLDNPVNDGGKLKAVLEDRYSFKKENITVLKNPTRIQILDSFEKLSKELGESDNLLIFYAGHGFWDERLEQGYWLPADASRASKAQWISNATIRDYVRGINTKHTLLIADACFSGGLLKSRGVGKAMMSLYNMPSRKAITSGTLTTVPDKSVFIEYLIKYLKNNEEKLMPADQIFYKIKISVINNSPNSQVPQYGPIHQANDEGGEFVFLLSEE